METNKDKGAHNLCCESQVFLCSIWKGANLHFTWRFDLLETKAGVITPISESNCVLNLNSSENFEPVRLATVASFTI